MNQFQELNDHSLDILARALCQKNHVLLGEASHGTSDYYTWRAKVTQKLITDNNFRFIAVEGDWPDCYRLNQFVKGQLAPDITARDVLRNFNRWPTWMWANWEVEAFITWLRKYNSTQPETNQVGFYGLDVYSLWESLAEIKKYVSDKHPELQAVFNDLFLCFSPYQGDEQRYALDTLRYPQGCSEEIRKLLLVLHQKRAELMKESAEDFFNVMQNALVIQNAEHYYHLMIQGGPDSWNVRDSHMFDTYEKLLEHYGTDAKGIVWAHNTHIGDARATDMARGGMHNIGQLMRQRYGKEAVALVGFGSYAGTVVAGKAWGAPTEVMTVPPAIPGSLEYQLHAQKKGNYWFATTAISDKLAQWIPHRAIGVVYDPAHESRGNYVPTNLAERYDWFIYVDSSAALHPIKDVDFDPTQNPPDTYPWGF